MRIAVSAGDDEWTVIERLPRRNVFCRSDSRGRSESLAANLDQLGVVIAPRPACDPFIVDRYLAGAEQAGIAALLICNKQDLPADADDLSFLEPLRAIGLPVVSVSARTGTGLDELVARLSGPPEPPRRAVRRRQVVAAQCPRGRGGPGHRASVRPDPARDGTRPCPRRS